MGENLDFNFSAQTVIVVGGTSGINLGVAKNFADAGASLGVISRSPEKVETAVELLGQSGGEVLGFSADVRIYDQITEGLTHFADEFGVFDVLVSGAAGNFPARANDISPNGFAAVVNIDLLGTFHVLKAAYPHLKKPGGSIINSSFGVQIGRFHYVGASVKVWS